MPDYCTRHPHSSPESARRCHERSVRRRADRKLRWVGNASIPSYRQVHNEPPRVVRHAGGVEVFVFYERERIAC